MDDYSVDAFIEGEMREGKSGTLKELADNAQKERDQKEFQEASIMGKMEIIMSQIEELKKLINYHE